MKCSVVRDLMPIYLEGKCRIGTQKVLEEHLHKCAECKELFQLMSEPILTNKNNLVVQDFIKIESQDGLKMEGRLKDRVMKEYYKNLIIKSGFIYIATYFFTVFITFCIISKMRN